MRVYNYMYVILKKGVGHSNSMYKNCDHSCHLQKMKIEFNLNFIVQVFKTPIKVEQYMVLHVIKKIINCVRYICSTREQVQVLKQLNNCRIAFV